MHTSPQAILETRAHHDPAREVGEGLGYPGLQVLASGPLPYASLLACDFAGTRLAPDAFIGVVRLDDVDLSDAASFGISFEDATLNSVHFRSATFECPSFRRAQLGCCDFTGATMPGADFSDVEANGTVRRPRGQVATLRFPSFFRQARLPGLVALNAGLCEADFSEADLTNAIFTGATLCRANFSRADLSGARWNGADLRGADLRHTRGLTGDALRLAVLDETTRLPEGLAGPAVIDLRATPGILVAPGR